MGPRGGPQPPPCLSFPPLAQGWGHSRCSSSRRRLPAGAAALAGEQDQGQRGSFLPPGPGTAAPRCSHPDSWERDLQGATCSTCPSQSSLGSPQHDKAHRCREPEPWEAGRKISCSSQGTMPKSQGESYRRGWLRLCFSSLCLQSKQDKATC